MTSPLQSQNQVCNSTIFAQGLYPSLPVKQLQQTPCSLQVRPLVDLRVSSVPILYWSLLGPWLLLVFKAWLRSSVLNPSTQANDSKLSPSLTKKPCLNVLNPQSLLVASLLLYQIPEIVRPLLYWNHWSPTAISLFSNLVQRLRPGF